MIKHTEDELPIKSVRFHIPVELNINTFYKSSKQFIGNSWGSVINDKCELYYLNDLDSVAEVYSINTLLPKVFIEGDL